MEGFLGLVARKIGSALAEKAANGASSFLWSQGSLLAGINGSMGRVEKEFLHIKALLGRIDTPRNNNKNMEAWIKDLRRIAYDMEDVIDEYTYLMAEESQYKLMGINCRSIKKATHLSAWHRIAARLKQIEDDAATAHQLWQRYGINMPAKREGSSSTRPATLSDYYLEDDQIIGMVNEKETLMVWMRDEAARENIIITVWGMGGSGKTKLVNSAYKNTAIQRHFDLTGWVTVSQTFHPLDILRRIYKSVASNDNREAEHEIERMDSDSLADKTRAFLRDRRFLIILDDVWDPDAYFMLETIFSTDPKPGSRIVITTRIKEVASLANEQRRMEHRTLRPDEAWDLFCNKAFRKDADRRCPGEVEQWGRKIVDKCGGLPLAIVVIARVMSLKEPSDWKQVCDRLSWEFTNNPKFDRVKHILNLSYYDLPFYLKNCFLYCSIFPEDYEITRSELIKLWVAEGFVETRGTQTVEDVADDYFTELLHRCMLQIVSRNRLGNVRICRMHDLIREFTVTIARDENFSTVVTDSQTPSSSVLNEARRLSIQDSCFPKESVDLSRMRSLIVFCRIESPERVLSSKTARFLRVLHLRNVRYIWELPDAVGDLFNLHYLNLKGTGIRRLPNSIGRLRKLQTLDLRETELWSLPKETTKLKNLRILAAHSINSKNIPHGLWNLTRLERLHICADEEIVKRLGNLTMLRKLVIKRVEGSNFPHLIYSLSRMEFLNKLSVSSFHRKLVGLKELGHAFRNLVCLELDFSLLDADLSLLVDSLGDGLEQLSLRGSQLRDDPLPQLYRVSNLTNLQLSKAYDGERLCFGAGWFSKLKFLRVFGSQNLTEIIFEKDSLGSLQIIYLGLLRYLKQLPQGIELQQSIKRFEIFNCSWLSLEMMREEQKCRITHIPTVEFLKYNRYGE